MGVDSNKYYDTFLFLTLLAWFAKRRPGILLYQVIVIQTIILLGSRVVGLVFQTTLPTFVRPYETKFLNN